MTSIHKRTQTHTQRKLDGGREGERPREKERKECAHNSIRSPKLNARWKFHDSKNELDKDGVQFYESEKSQNGSEKNMRGQSDREREKGEPNINDEQNEEEAVNILEAGRDAN